MTESVKLTGATSGLGKRWNAIDWHKVNKEVMQLQMRIAKAVKEKKWNKVKSLQWVLAHSFSAKLLAKNKQYNRRSSVKRRLNRGLSRMTGNYLIRFLEGIGSASSPLCSDMNKKTFLLYL